MGLDRGQIANWHLTDVSAEVKGVRMPIELVWLGGVLVVFAGGLMFLFLQRRKPVERPSLW